VDVAEFFFTRDVLGVSVWQLLGGNVWVPSRGCYNPLKFILYAAETAAKCTAGLVETTGERKKEAGVHRCQDE